MITFFSFLGYGLITTIAANRLPNVEEGDWLEVYQTTNPPPSGATQALILVNALPSKKIQ